jgi:hypothetical protein
MSQTQDPSADPTQAASTDPSANQAADPSATAAISGTTVELKLRIFIPCNALTALSFTGRRAFAGDGRDFSYSSGTSRAELVANVTVSPSGVLLVSRKFGLSSEYNFEDAIPVAGKPDWFMDVRPGAAAIATDTLQVTDDNLNISLGVGDSTTEGIFSVAERTTVVNINVAGALPLMTGAPDIDATLYVHFKTDGVGVQALVHGTHDGFPAYELYLNQKLVYQFDPVAAGTSPTNLLPPEDITVSTSYTWL